MRRRIYNVQLKGISPGNFGQTINEKYMVEGNAIASDEIWRQVHKHNAQEEWAWKGEGWLWKVCDIELLYDTRSCPNLARPYGTKKREVSKGSVPLTRRTGNIFRRWMKKFSLGDN